LAASPLSNYCLTIATEGSVLAALISESKGGPSIVCFAGKKHIYRIGGLAHFVPSQQPNNKCSIRQKNRRQCSENTRTIKSKFPNSIGSALSLFEGCSPDCSTEFKASNALSHNKPIENNLKYKRDLLQKRTTLFPEIDLHALASGQKIMVKKGMAK